MKKALLISTLLLVFFMTTGIASARVFFGFGFFPPAVVGPPVIVAPPPAYYPYPDGYYGQDIMVIESGSPAIGTIYGLVTVGRKCGIRDIGSIVPKAGTDPIPKTVLPAGQEVVFSERKETDCCLKTRGFL